jgi:hypothetical protein
MKVKERKESEKRGARVRGEKRREKKIEKKGGRGAKTYYCHSQS